MKQITEYTDYRHYILDYYTERKMKGAFTWREFARNAGFSSPVYLKQVSDGQFNLSAEAVERVAAAMGLTGLELLYFRAMVKFNHAPDDRNKKRYFAEMLSIAGDGKVKVLEGDAFKFFSSWKNQVIRELAYAMPGAKPLELAHACRPKITAAEVSETLKFLTQVGLLRKDENGNYSVVDKAVTTGPMEVTPVAVRGLHREMGEFALEAIEGVPLSERHFSGLTLGVTQEAYQKIVEEIAAFRKRVVAIATAQSETDQVYRLNLQFFPMTKITKKNSKQ